MVVEDDRSVREMLTAVLVNEGYEVEAFADAESAATVASTGERSAVVLDVGLPGTDGITFCRRLRHDGYEGGVLMLTARHEVADRVGGLDAGADDYLVKPFALDELLARVRALVRRSSGRTGQRPIGDDLRLGELKITVGARQVTVGGESIDLTRIEFDLLRLLVSNTPNVLPRGVIHDRVWGYAEDLGSNSLEVFISQVRRKLEAGGRPRIIHTVRGVGYVARLSR